tara:strand:- start:7526 stop:9478 length:1953 start_codon:yes stop_codon:yes gene_type:complete
LALLVYCYSYSSISQTTTDWDYVNPSDATQTTGTCPSGTVPAHISSNWGGGDTPAIAFGGCHDIFAISFAINQALSNAGTDISIDAVEYTWKWINGCYNVTKSDGSHEFCTSNIDDRLDDNFKPTGEYADQFDTLIVTVQIKDSNGNVIQEKIYDYDTWYHWAEANSHSTSEVNEDGVIWQLEQDSITLFNHNNMSGTIYGLNQLSNFHVQVEGNDGGYWTGNYGPVIKDGGARFTYRPNPCLSNALYDASCPGYAEAYALQLYDQQCQANSLFDSLCPGYDTAYSNQQCSLDPLYNQGCTGYAVAYFNQQCSIDPLYNFECDGYATAYLSQQCAIDVLYSSECTGYDEAYLTLQCSLNTLYDATCPGYEFAYFNNQCSINPQYAINCPGYIEPKEEIESPIEALETPTIVALATSVIIMPIEPVINILPDIEIEIIEIPEPIQEEIEINIIEEIETEIEIELKVEVKEEEVESVSKEVEETEDQNIEPVSEDETEESQDTVPEVSDEVDEEEQKEVQESDSSDEVEVAGGTDTESSDKATGDAKDNNEESKKLTKKEKIKKILANKLKSLAKDMGQAASLEQQKQIQQQVLALINYNPDFKKYGTTLPGGYYPDTNFYQTKQLADSKRGLRMGLANQILHNKMVDMQWK